MRPLPLGRLSVAGGMGEVYPPRTSRSVDRLRSSLPEALVGDADRLALHPGSANGVGAEPPQSRSIYEIGEPRRTGLVAGCISSRWNGSGRDARELLDARRLDL